MQKNTNFKNPYDDIITLYNEKGEPTSFTVVAGVTYQSAFYLIMQPLELLEGMEDNEAFVFKVTQHNGRDCYEIQINDDIIDGVFEEYNKLLDEASSN